MSRCPPEIGVRLWYLKFLEERLGHIVITVLTRVNRNVLERMAPQCADKWGDLHEVRADTHDGHDFQW
jgi:hypothetical protein